MKQYIVGWDGGGTKTAIQIRDLDKKIIYNGKSGPLNYNSQSEEELRKTIKTLINDMETISGSLELYKCLCISTAGVCNKEAVIFIEKEVRNAGYKNKLIIVGDQEAALYGAMGKSEGIILISGTGSICYGKNKEGKSFRSGGWGHLIDDEGSGYAIGRDILSAAVRSYDKRNKESILYEAVLDAIGGKSINDIIHYTYKVAESKRDIASLAPILMKAVENDDEQALAICKKAAKELATLVITVARELQLECGELAFIGGILNHYKCINNMVRENIKSKLPNIKLVKPENDSVTGAVLMAFDNMDK